MAGTDATGVAIGYALYAQTHSAAWLSLSLLLTIGAAVVLAPLGGRAGDVMDRRRLMISAEIAACAVFLALAVVHSTYVLLGLGLLAAAIGTAFGPASGAAIAHIAGEQHLAWANGLVGTSSNLGKMVGRLAAGGLIAVLGTSTVFGLDALTFLVSACVIRSVRLSFSGAVPDESAAPAADPPAAEPAAAPLPAEPVTEPAAPPAADPGPGGLRFVVRHRALRLIAASACVSTFATAFSMTAEVPLVFQLHAGAIGLGGLTACWAAGMVAGSWHGGRALHRGNEATGVLAGRLAMAAGVALVAACPSISPALACYLLGGMGGGFMGVAMQSLVLRHSPAHMQARTLAAIDGYRNLAFGVGVTGAGALVGLLGAREVYLLVGLAMTIGTLPVAALVVRLGGPRALRPARAT
jgi:MFS family permease